MQHLRQFLLWMGRRAQNAVALLLLSMFVTFILQIVFRYLLDLPIGWTVEWVSIAWLWGILFGYAFVVRETEVIRLDVIYSGVSRNARRVLDVITGLSIAGIFAYSLPATWDYVTFMSIERTAYMRLPFSWVFAIYMAFAISVIIRGLITAWAGITGSGRLHNTELSAESHDYD